MLVIVKFYLFVVKDHEVPSLSAKMDIVW